VATKTGRGHLIRRLRTERGWTQEQLAERLGTSRFRIVEWEKGNGPGPMYLAALAREFGRPVEDFAVTPPEDSLEQAMSRLGAVSAQLEHETRLRAERDTEVAATLRDLQQLHEETASAVEATRLALERIEALLRELRAAGRTPR
jgi:transcriptional regulator with XRE-family HTH domain